MILAFEIFEEVFNKHRNRKKHGEKLHDSGIRDFRKSSTNIEIEMLFRCSNQNSNAD